MKRISLIIFIVFIVNTNYGQVSGNFNVGGDSDKFYPVTFYDGGWANNVPTSLTLGRSIVHTDSSCRGSLMASFNFHVTEWGNNSNFIEANIKQSQEIDLLQKKLSKIEKLIFKSN